MCNKNANNTQKAFLERYLRGTGKTLTFEQARTRYGIQNLYARMAEFREAGLRVRITQSRSGINRYAVSRADVEGSSARVFS